MNARIISFVWRAEFTQRTVLFYELIGLNFSPSQHGGPVHFETSISQESILEIYPLRALPIFGNSGGALVVEVDNHEKVLLLLLEHRFIETKESPRKLTVYQGVELKDPDGRTVVIIEKKS